MSRTVPWRSKPTHLITQMLPVCREYKLYLLNEIGPTCFLFKDDNDNKFKVNIGNTVSCSCGIVVNDHCIHTLYVMLKKFQVGEDNPILWQASYIDSELQGLVQMKYQARKKPVIAQHKIRKPIRQTDKGNMNQQDQFPQLGEDDMCPICYQSMQAECYSTCSTCHKSMHTKCFKVWAKHKEENQVDVTCPMCRTPFEHPMAIIFQDLERWNKKKATHPGTYCRACKTKNIVGTLYKCLVCSRTELCGLCFNGMQHNVHNKFVYRNLSTEQWSFVIRKQKPSSKKQQTLFVNTKNLKHKYFPMNLLPTCKQHSLTQQDFGGLQIVGNETSSTASCSHCNKSGNDMMHRQPCGHLIHGQCIRSILESDPGNLFCQIDGQPWCPGYMEALEIKYQKKKKDLPSKVQSEPLRTAFKNNVFEINHFVPRVGPLGNNNISVGGTIKQPIRSKEKNFRISQRPTSEKRPDTMLRIGNFEAMPIMVTGMSHQKGTINAIQTRNQPIQIQLPPKPHHRSSRLRGNQ